MAARGEGGFLAGEGGLRGDLGEWGGGARGCQELGRRGVRRPRTRRGGEFYKNQAGSQTLGCGRRLRGWLSGAGGATTAAGSTSSHSPSPPMGAQPRARLPGHSLPPPAPLLPGPASPQRTCFLLALEPPSEPLLSPRRAPSTRTRPVSFGGAGEPTGPSARLPAARPLGHAPGNGTSPPTLPVAVRGRDSNAERLLQRWLPGTGPWASAQQALGISSSNQVPATRSRRPDRAHLCGVRASARLSAVCSGHTKLSTVAQSTSVLLPAMLCTQFAHSDCPSPGLIGKLLLILQKPAEMSHV